MTKSFDSLVASIKERVAKCVLGHFKIFFSTLYQQKLGISIKLTLDKHDSLITGFEWFQISRDKLPIFMWSNPGPWLVSDWCNLRQSWPMRGQVTRLWQLTAGAAATTQLLASTSGDEKIQYLTFKLIPFFPVMVISEEG